MPTFSVNRDIYANARKVGEIMQTSSAGGSGEWKGTAFLQLVDKEEKRGKKSGTINMSAYARVCENNAQLKRATSKETNVLTQEEIARGYSGVAEAVAQYTDENLDVLLDEMDETFYIEKFQEVQKEMFFGFGMDLWRMVKLAKTKDRRAREILQKIAEKSEEYKELIEYVAKNPKCIQKLGDIIC